MSAFVRRLRGGDEPRDLNAELLEANAHLALALEAARAGMFRFEPASGTIVWSDELERLHGLEPGSFDGSYEQAVAFVHPGDRPRLLELARSALAAGEAFSAEYRVVWPDGALHWLELKVTFDRDGEGEPSLVGVCVDIDERKAIAENAQREHDRYRTLAEQLPLVTFIATKDVGEFRFEYVGPQIEQLLGVDRDRWCNEAKEFIDAADRERVLRMAGAARRIGQPVKLDFALVAADGTRIPVHYEAVPLPSGRVQGFMLDLREREHARERLAASEQRFANLFAGAPLGTALIELDRGVSRTVEVNEHLCQMTGYSQEELLARQLTSLLHHHDAERVQRLLREIAAGSRTRFVSDLRYRAADGRDCWVRATCSLLESSGGTGTHVIGMFEDITEQLATQTRLQTMLDNVPVGVAIGDTAGTIREPNNELLRMLGYDDPSELIGLTFPQISHPEDADTLQLVLDHVASGSDGRIQFEKRYLRRDGEPLWTRVTVAPVVGEMDWIVSVIEDLSEKRAFEEQLRQAQKLEAIGLLAGGIAHDFNNLLMVIGGYASMLVDSEALPESARLHASEIMGAYARGADLTQQLLAFSRRTQLNTRVLSLNDTVREMRGLLARLVGERITLELELEPELGATEADESQLGQVFMNLAANARDAMPEGGSLRLVTTNRTLGSAEAERLKVTVGDYVELAVMDSGEGMDQRTQAHVFEPFFTTKPQGKGTGLGLAVSYGIVSQSGGTIELESAPGAGATFRILLPRTEANRARGMVPPRVQPGALAVRVLLVEDEEQVRLLTTQMLEQLGCTVCEAATPEEALARARELRTPIDVLVTDVVMPGMSGPALVEELAADRADLAVLYVSGYTASTVAARGSELGRAFLSKPYTREQLKMALVNLIGRRMPAPESEPVARGDAA